MSASTPTNSRKFRALARNFSISMMAFGLIMPTFGWSQELEDKAAGSNTGPEETLPDQESAPAEEAFPQPKDEVVSADTEAELELGTEAESDSDSDSDSGTGNALASVVEVSTLPWNVANLTLAELHEQFMLNYSGEQHPEARELGEVIVDRVEKEEGPESLALVIPLNNLATVNELLGRYDVAIQQYLRSVNIIERHKGQYDADLIRPLTGMGLAQQAAGLHTQAIGTFQRAQHVTHRKDGVFSMEQLDLLDLISDNFAALDNYTEADRAQRLWFRVNEHNLGRGSVEVLPALYKLADWFISVGQYTNALNAYERGINVLEENFGEDDISLIDPLRGIAKAGSGRGRTHSQSTKALERAYEILEKNPDTDPTKRALTLVELADIYTVTNKVNLAKERYAEAWESLNNVDDPQSARRTLFGEPVKLFHPVLLMAEDTFTRRRVGEYFVEIEFSVGTDGHVKNVVVVDANAPSEARRMVRQMARRARYRPRFEDGMAVETSGIVSTQKVKLIDPEQECGTFGCRRKTQF